MHTPEPSDRFIWIDLEMSGLDPDQHVILEIASLVTDDRLQVVAEGPDIAIHHPEAVLSRMDGWSREHHEASGLLERVRASDVSCGQAEHQTMTALSRYCRPGASPLCGNSIWQDRRFLARYMPRLEGFFHYRIIDVSSVKELVRRWFPRLPPFEKQKSHLAAEDIRESVEELTYYRNFLLASAGTDL